MKSLESHPEWPVILDIASVLTKAGFKVVLAGGCVRDGLIGRQAKDLDVATDARPEQVEALFPKVIPVGKSFGVCRVIHKDVDVEVATFREESDYTDGRHPEKIIYSTMEKDAFRRDFTMNGMFYDLVSKEVVDLVGGAEDIKKGIIRTVGEPTHRFSEDHLRLLRGARFSAQLGFKIETQTRKAMATRARDLATVSKERIQEELHKAFQSQSPFSFFETCKELGFLEVLFPNWKWDVQRELKDYGIQNWSSWAHLKKQFNQAFEDIDLAWTHLGLHASRSGFETGDLKRFYKEMKLSKNSIERVFKCLSYEAIFYKKVVSFEDQFELAKEPSFLAIVDYWDKEWVMLTEKFPQESQWEEFKKKYLVEGRLPLALVSGKDLLGKGYEAGPQIKNLLDELYHRQIKESIQDKSILLSYLGDKK